MNDEDRPHCFWCCPNGPEFDLDYAVPKRVADLPLWAFALVAVAFWLLMLGLFGWAVPKAMLWLAGCR